MPAKQKVFIAIALFSLLLIPFTFDVATSVTPGWHTTTTYGPGWLQVLLPVYFFFVSVLYRFIQKREIKVGSLFFGFHVVISVLPQLYINFLFVQFFLNPASFSPQQLLADYRIHQVVFNLFIISQLSLVTVLLLRLFMQNNCVRQTIWG